MLNLTRQSCPTARAESMFAQCSDNDKRVTHTHTRWLCCFCDVTGRLEQASVWRGEGRCAAHQAAGAVAGGAGRGGGGESQRPSAQCERELERARVAITSLHMYLLHL